MCKHNLVIGQEYSIDGGLNTCRKCNYTWGNNSTPAIYVGDREIGYHLFRLVTPTSCTNCGNMLDSINVLCEEGGPIDVTQEFLSLPVRSKE